VIRTVSDCLVVVVIVAEDAVVLASGIAAALSVVAAAAAADPQIQFVVWGMQYVIAQVASQALANIGQVAAIVVAVVSAVAIVEMARAALFVGQREIAKVVVVRIL
jgi:hypothetical protein